MMPLFPHVMVSPERTTMQLGRNWFETFVSTNVVATQVVPARAAGAASDERTRNATRAGFTRGEALTGR